MTQRFCFFSSSAFHVLGTVLKFSQVATIKFEFQGQMLSTEIRIKNLGLFHPTSAIESPSHLAAQVPLLINGPLELGL